MKYQEMLNEMLDKINYVIDIIYNDKRTYKALRERNLVEEYEDCYYSLSFISGLTIGDYDYIGFGWGNWSAYKQGEPQTRNMDTAVFKIFAHDDANYPESLPMELLEMTDEQIIQWVVEKESEYAEKQNKQLEIKKQIEIQALEDKLKRLKSKS